MSATRNPIPSAPEIRHFRRHQHLVREGDAPEAIYRLEEGWACRYKLLGSGRRQITALFLPGEYCEPQWLLEARTAHPVVALTACARAGIRWSSSRPARGDMEGGRDS